MRTLTEIMDALPIERRLKIERRAEELIAAEEERLRQVCEKPSHSAEHLLKEGMLKVV